MKKLLLLLVIVFAVAFAQNPEADSVGEPKIDYKLYAKGVADFVDDCTAPRILWFWNNNGDSLRDGDVVILDSIEVAAVAVYLASGAGGGTYDTCTIADSAEAVHWQKLYVYASNADSDTVIVQGLDSTNTALYDTIILASGATRVYSTHFFRKINLAYVTDANESIGVYVVPHGCVKHTTAAGHHMAVGIVQNSVKDDTLVKVLVSGVDEVKIKGATTRFLPGAWLQTTTTAGYLAPVTTSNAGVGIALTSGNTDGTFTAYICPVNLAAASGYFSSITFSNGYAISNPHSDSAYHNEAVNKFSGDIRIMDNDIFFGNGATIKNKHSDSLDFDESVYDFNSGKFVSDGEFTIHVSAFDFLYAASGVTYIPAEGCVHPTAAAEAIYAPLNIPFNLFGGTVVVDTIMAFFNTDASGDDFDLAIIKTDHDGSLTTAVDKDDIGNGGTGADSLACITTDVTLTDHAYHVECDVNNTDAATDVKIYDIRLKCHLE